MRSGPLRSPGFFSGIPGTNRDGIGSQALRPPLDLGTGQQFERGFVDQDLGALALGLLAWWLLGRDTVDVATCNTQFKSALVGKTINFDTGDAVIAADSKKLLGQLAEIADRCKAFNIEIGGHTDTVGDPAMNKTLSQSRANAVRAYLVEKGVPEGQLTAVGYGAERPAVATGNEVAMAANRRIEFTVSK